MVPLGFCCVQWFHFGFTNSDLYSSSTRRHRRVKIVQLFGNSIRWKMRTIETIVQQSSRMLHSFFASCKKVEHLFRLIYQAFSTQIVYLPLKRPKSTEGHKGMWRRQPSVRFHMLSGFTLALWFRFGLCCICPATCGPPECISGPAGDGGEKTIFS